MQTHLLIVEDEPSIADNLCLAFERDGIQSTHATTLEAARQAWSRSSFDMIILDIGLPDGSGFDFCREIRKTSLVPVIMLTARSDEIDRVVGLEIGADDYVCKPFSPRELVARVWAILRRTVSYRDLEHHDEPAISNGGLVVRADSFEVFWNGQALSFSAYEFRLVKVLAEHPGRVFSRRQLLDRAWDDPYSAMERTVDAHVKSLRAKLKKVAGKDLIVTHRGLGYSLEKN